MWRIVAAASKFQLRKSHCVAITAGNLFLASGKAFGPILLLQERGALTRAATKAEWLADYLRSILPEAIQQQDEARAETIQTGAWLVGLASALLALFISNKEKLPFLSSSQAKLVVFLLGLSVFLGVAQRVFLLIANGAETKARFALVGWLTAYRSALDFAEPLSDEWSRDEILANLKQYYDLDYSFLPDSDHALTDLRRIYTQVHQSFTAIDVEQLRLIWQQIGTYMGWNQARIDNEVSNFQGYADKDPNGFHIHHTTWFGLAAISLFGSSASFSASIVSFALAFILA